MNTNQINIKSWGHTQLYLEIAPSSTKKTIFGARGWATILVPGKHQNFKEGRKEGKK